jgi:hypothetical protein
MLPMHARSARLAEMRFYRRRRQREEFRKARRVIRLAKANRFRIATITGSLVLLLIELGFFVGLFAARVRG